jgi:hypothetical protein
MALWTLTPNQDHDVYTVVYFLKDALRSALGDAWYLERTALPNAETKGGAHAEIAARLGRFRDGCKNFQQREALLFVKLLRARNWAAELRKLVPDFQADIDQFLSSTEPCEGMKGDFLRDAQRMFNGGASLVRFLIQRKRIPDETQAEDENKQEPAYLVGGHKALYELRIACEIFLEQIDGEFFSDGPGARNSELALAFLEKLDERLDGQPAESLH